MQHLDFKQRLDDVRGRIEHAATASGRKGTDIELVAVSKTMPAAQILAAYAAGQRTFGENYVSELAAKAAALPDDIAWHHIGPVQRRSVAKLPPRLALLQTLDRLELLDRFAGVWQGNWPPFLVQINIGNEPQKHGIPPDDAERFFAAALRKYPDLKLLGLMAIPPADLPETATRKHFAALRDIAARLAAICGRTLKLSMGMSQDFEAAIAEGADIVRIGSAIFGARQPNHA